MKHRFRSILTLLPVAGLFVAIAGCDDKKDPAPVVHEMSVMTDIDNNNYTTVKIGNQWWMAENLKVTKYRNGMPIPEVTDSADWVNQSTGAWCRYENGTGQVIPEGLLYNYMTITNPNILAPEGWHIPTDEEWKTLEKELGMTQQQANGLSWRGNTEGDKMKSTGANEWNVIDGNLPDNESGFSALAESCRLFNSEWGAPGLRYTGFWWTASPYGTEESWYRHLDYKNTNVFRSHTNNHYGFSIRCVKD